MVRSTTQREISGRRCLHPTPAHSEDPFLSVGASPSAGVSLDLPPCYLRWSNLELSRAFALGHAPTSFCVVASRNQVSPMSTTLPQRTSLDRPEGQAYVDETSFPPLLRAQMQVMKMVKDGGLLKRARWFYVLVGVAIAVALGGCVTGFVLLRDSWFQLLIAGALGVVFTQVAFLAHEAAHRQILSSGPTNDRLARVLAGLHRHELLLVELQALASPRQPQHGGQGPRHRARTPSPSSRRTLPRPAGSSAGSRAARAGCSSRCSRWRA